MNHSKAKLSAISARHSAGFGMPQSENCGYIWALRGILPEVSIHIDTPLYLPG